MMMAVPALAGGDPDDRGATAGQRSNWRGAAADTHPLPGRDLAKCARITSLDRLLLISESLYRHD